MSQKNSSKTQIIVALIGLLGIVGGSIIANWDKIFPSKDISLRIDRQKTSMVATDAEKEKIEQLFSQLDSFNVDLVYVGAEKLSLYANDSKYANQIFLRLKVYLSSLKAPHNLKTEASQNYGMDKEKAEKKAKNREEARIKPLLNLVNHFKNEMQIELYKSILHNRSLTFGRFMAADELCTMEGNGIYWIKLLDDSDPYFRELTVNAIRDRSQNYIEDVLIEALRKPDIRTLAIYGLEEKQSKKAVPYLIDILKHDSDEWARFIAYKALEKIDPEKTQQFPRPPKPTLPELPPLF